MNVEMYRDPAPARCDACGHQLWLHDHRGCHVHGCTRCGRRWCGTHIEACPANCPREQTLRTIESFVMVAAVFLHSFIFALIVVSPLPMLALSETLLAATAFVKTYHWWNKRRGGSR